MQKPDPQLSLTHYQQILRQNPKNLDAQIHCGNCCVELGKFEEAAGYFRRIVRVLKNNPQANHALCFALQALGNQCHAAGQFTQAEACFEEALQFQPSNAAFWYNLGNAQRELLQPKKALFAFQKALSIDANDADTHNNLGNVLRELGRLDEAIAAYKTALTINPNLHHALVHLVHQQQHVCDWQNLETNIATIRYWVNTEPAAQIAPFAFLAMPGTTAAEQLTCASNWAAQISAGIQALPTQNTHHRTIKIGYLSADFRLHPLAFLITDLIKAHDRKAFHVTAYSNSALDTSAERKALERAFDAWVEIGALSNNQAAQKIQADGCDILVDLTGFTQNSRSQIAAFKPARIHINWLGFAGSMGAVAGVPLFDYLIADSMIIPETDAQYYAENIIHLPCYQPNNAARPVGDAGTRAQHNLPADALVFCCFNQSFKITPDVFATWMNILQSAPNSVLWLLDCNAWATANLEAACAATGIQKSRLIFAPRCNIAEHLARHAHADLFLDTLPYNAHTTASDALFMGLPILTVLGETFASRVTASLLNGFTDSSDSKPFSKKRLNGFERPNFVCANLAQYQATAIALASNPSAIRSAKNQLLLQLNTSPLFQPVLFAKQLEAEFLRILKAKH